MYGKIFILAVYCYNLAAIEFAEAHSCDKVRLHKPQLCAIQRYILIYILFIYAFFYLWEVSVLHISEAFQLVSM